MAIKSRQELKPQFDNGKIPTKADFCDLIESMLNRADDNFFGQWQPGVKYCNGDVVIYANSLFVLKKPKTGAAAVVSAEKTTAKARTVAPPPPDATDCLCSITPPDCDSDNWQKLEFDLKDKDWEYDTPGLLYAMDLKDLVGIGTAKPVAKLHVAEETRGRFLLNPTDPLPGQPHDPAGPTDPEFRIERDIVPDCDLCYVSERLAEDWLHLETSGNLGFCFEYGLVKGTPPMVLAAMTPDGLGVLTKSPGGTLDVHQACVGQFLVNPKGSLKATVQLKNLHPDEANAHLTETIDGQFATFETDAKQGFKFQPTAPKNGAKTNGSTPASVVIDENGHVGIGTDSPAAHLEIVQPGCGKALVFLENANPALAVVNTKPAGKASYLTVGADNSFAVLKTDAPCGFVFKHGDAFDPANLNGPEKSLVGDPQIYIDQDGKLGIGTPPNQYELDLNGSSRSYEAYLNTNETTIKNPKPIEDALSIVCKLTPIRFEWKEPGTVLSKSPQFGLYADQCADYAPEVVKEVDKQGHAIAYQNLVPVLIKAMQEQQKIIDNLLARVDALEHKKY